MAKRMPKIGGTFLQAESEIAAINMVYGAAGAGVARHDLLLQPGRVPQAARASAISRARNCPA